MRILISPAKQMKADETGAYTLSKPAYLKEAKQLANQLKGYTQAELKPLLNASDKIVSATYQQYQRLNLDAPGSAALLTYQGIQYKYLAANTLEDDQLAFLQEHLLIVSGLYGLLRPFDEIQLYRLEMQTKIGLYDYWAHLDTEETFLNLASHEYAKLFKNRIDVHFLTDGQEKGVYAKMARGAMVNFIAQKKSTERSVLTQFNEQNYQFDPQQSDATTLVFSR